MYIIIFVKTLCSIGWLTSRNSGGVLNFSWYYSSRLVKHSPFLHPCRYIRFFIIQYQGDGPYSSWSLGLTQTQKQHTKTTHKNHTQKQHTKTIHKNNTQEQHTKTTNKKATTTKHPKQTAMLLGTK